VPFCDVTLKYLTVYGSGRQMELAAEFVKYILRRAWDGGGGVWLKRLEVVLRVFLRTSSPPR
jgi:hypothetical protein